MSSDEAGGIGGEKDRGTNELVKLAEALHWCAHKDLPRASTAIKQTNIEVGAKDPGRNRVHADTEPRPFDSERFGQRRNCCLAGRVCRHLMEGDKRRERGNINDASVTALDHMAAEDLAGAQRPVEVGFDDLIPVALANVERWTAHCGPGGIDEDINVAEFGAGLRKKFIEGLLV